MPLVLIARAYFAEYTVLGRALARQEKPMSIDLRTAPLQLVRKEDGAAIDLAPLQGLWTAEQYLILTDHTRYLVEFTDGVIEVLPIATDKHQTILEFQPQRAPVVLAWLSWTAKHYLVERDKRHFAAQQCC